MKTSFKIGSIALMAIGGLLFTSCKNDHEEITVSQEKTIRLYVSGVETRTSTGDYNKTNLHENNTVGAFAEATGGSIVNQSNNKYSVGSEGTLTAENGEIRVSAETTKVDVYAYAPHDGAYNSHTTAQTFSVQTDQSDDDGYLKSDLLWATGSVTPISSTTENKVSLNFSHKMARVKLTIETDEDLDEDLTGASVTVNNTKTTIPFTPKSGELGTASGSVTPITALSSLDSDNTDVYCIVVPQTVSSGTELFIITTENNKYTFKVNEAVTFDSGYSYTYTLKVNPKENITILLDKPTVEDWNDEDKGSLDSEVSEL